MEAFLGFFCGIVLSCVLFYFFWSFYKNKYEFLKNSNVLQDLELATSEQLLDQFRSRPNNSYIILLQIKDDNEQGIKVECNNFSPTDSISLLHLATGLMRRELKLRGIALPDLPNLDDQ